MEERVSRYLVVGEHSYRDGDGERVRVVYATRTAAILAVDEQSAIALVKGDVEGVSSGARAELRDCLALVPAEEDEFASVLGRKRAAAADPSTLRYALLPTSFCNMGCEYCGQSHSAGVIPRGHRDAVRERVCSAIARPTTKVVEVAWFGAEPLVGLGAIRDLSRSFVEAAEQSAVSYSAKMPTNGSLLTLKKLRILHDECRLTQLEITLDGPAHVHDRHRPLKRGGGSFHHIIDVLSQALQVEGLDQLHISLRTNVDANNRDDIDEYIDYVASLGCFADDRVSFYFAPVHAWSNDVSAIQLHHHEFAALEATWLRTMAANGLNVSTLPSEPKDVVCKAVTTHAEVVSSTGRVFSCTEQPLVASAENDSTALGRIDDPEFPQPRPRGPYDDWHDAVERHETPCGECVFLPTCGGSCPKLWREGYWPCPSYKFNISELFDLIAAQNGLVPIAVQA